MGSNLVTLPSVGRLPLRDRGGVVQAWAEVSPEDFPRLSQHRWYRRPNGYAARQVSIGRKRQQTVLLHREVMGLAVGDPQKVDHRDHDPLNCRRENLRICTHAENHQNREATGDRDSSSRHRGVSRKKGAMARPWQAYGCLDGRIVYLGYFATEDEAAEAARAWRAEHMPFTTN